MSQRLTEEPTAHVEKRLNKFLDCVARLLAKRSLREQQDDEQETPEKERGEDEQ